MYSAGERSDGAAFSALTPSKSSRRRESRSRRRPAARWRRPRRRSWSRPSRRPSLRSSSHPARGGRPHRCGCPPRTSSVSSGSTTRRLRSQRPAPGSPWPASTFAERHPLAQAALALVGQHHRLRAAAELHRGQAVAGAVRSAGAGARAGLPPDTRGPEARRDGPGLELCVDDTGACCAAGSSEHAATPRSRAAAHRSAARGRNDIEAHNREQGCVVAGGAVPASGVCPPGSLPSPLTAGAHGAPVAVRTHGVERGG